MKGRICLPQIPLSESMIGRRARDKTVVNSGNPLTHSVLPRNWPSTAGGDVKSKDLSFKIGSICLAAGLPRDSILTLSDTSLQPESFMAFARQNKMVRMTEIRIACL
jgi:hypothetical protein